MTSDNASVAMRLAALPKPDRDGILAEMNRDELAALEWDWSFWGRKNQFAPPGRWAVWLILAGRGFGKTRTGAEWVRANVCGSTPLGRGKYRQIALVAETAADAREVMVGDGKAPGGGSGILQVHPPDFRPVYEPSKRRLTWPNGAIATLYNAVEPEQLRGPEHDAAVCDELAKWRYVQDTWDQLQFGLRRGTDPRVVITTTPKPIKTLRQIITAPSTIVTRGSTYDNSGNLPRAFFEQVINRFEGTRLGRQELDGDLLEDTPGALWNMTVIDRLRLPAPPPLTRIVVAIDPAVTSGDESDETGIVAAGHGIDGHFYVLEDVSGRYTPDEWARAAIGLYRKWSADRIIGEVNNGGEMIEAVLRVVDPNVPYTPVRATRGKAVRAEPIAALYEQEKAHHTGAFEQLEDQMCMFTSDFDKARAGYSPDRVDALVWAMTALTAGPSLAFGSL